ncbi:MAG: hypothetical protein ACREFR_14695 [Limisphaerales bacterium]
MKKKCLSILTATVTLGLCLYGSNARSQSANGMLYTDDYAHHVGVGIQLGAPIGVNAKYWLNDMLAVDGAFGLSPYAHAPAEIHADFLVHDFDLFSLDSGKLPVYFGAGLVGRFRDDGRSDLGGFRFPIGISYMFEDVPIDIFAEVAPEVIFAPFGRGYLDGAVGIRFWF